MTVHVFGCFPDHATGGHGLVGPPLDYTLRRALSVWCDGEPGHGLEGQAFLRKDARLGVTAVDWRDRQGDSRPGSHTCVFVFADMGATELLALAREQVPWAFRVDVALQPWGET